MIRGSTMLARAWSAALALLACAVACPAAAKCQISATEIHVILKDHRTYIPAEINGHKVLFLFDTGADISQLFEDAAAQLKLPMAISLNQITSYGVGGGTQGRVRTARIGELQLDQFKLENQSMITSGQGDFARDNVAGLIGREMFLNYDLDLDFPDKLIRVVKPSGCNRDQMVFWSQPYAEAPILPTPSPLETHVKVLLNGVPLDAQIDSGAGVTIVSTGAAERAGAALAATQRELSFSGLGGGGRISSQVAHFATFTLGDETIRNPDIRLADLSRNDTYMELGTRLPQRALLRNEMLLGWDFLSSHHLLISESQGMVYFSYIGGPVFDAALDGEKGGPARPAPQTTPTPVNTPY